MFAGKTWAEWITQYEQSQQHPVNRLCHTLGIPLIAASLPLLVVGLLAVSGWRSSLLWLSVLLFTVGWVFQFIGHGFDGKLPECFSDWRFLFVGLRWWWQHVRGPVAFEGEQHRTFR